MTILFVLLTFLVLMAVTYYTKRGQPAVTQRVPVFTPATAPTMMRDYGFEIPKGYCFHPGHTWVLDEGRQNARVGLDSFAANLIGKIDRVEVAGLNRWVRQGQKVWSITRDGLTVDMVAPVEGVVIAVNPEVQKDPSLITRDPYKDGWVCVIKSPDLTTNTNNLLRGTFVGPWMQNSLRRLSSMTPQMSGTAAADGGVPVPGLLAQVDPATQRAMTREFFLT
ncbi:MAG: glycine cleavage system protein H [Terriglobales bacterium]